MTDIENKIRKLEREKKIADEKFAKELASIKLENEHEETLTTTQIKDIKQAHKLGFKPKEIAHRFDLPFDSVNHVCRNENARKNWLKNHGKPKSHTFTYFTPHKKCIRMQEPNITSLAGMHAYEKKCPFFLSLKNPV